ncbi:MAG: BspA family leucine-rich repeat surface protein [Erysipelotrichaceae bacterium]|nr:BspA family leucine-rich repeat surface protein [Erysipelotrichaceae bacterium]
MADKLVKIILAIMICLSVVIADHAVFTVSAEDEVGDSERIDVVPTSGTAYAVFADNGDLIFVRSPETYENGVNGTLADIYGNEYTGIIYADIENTENIPWADKRNSIIRVYVAPETEIKPQIIRWWFGECRNLVSFNATGFDTENASSMAHLFHNCRKLETLDLSLLSTARVQVMCSMFEGCSSLRELNISSFNTSSVYDMTEMFKGCEKLTSLSLNNFVTTSVIGMKGMFEGCKALTSLDLSKITTAKNTDMSFMFRNCSSLTSLDVSKLHTAKVTDMQQMFAGCTSLTSLSINGIKTSKVTNMASMFESCSSLSSLNLGSFDTAKVTDMSGMFYGCSSLNDLNISSFNTAAVTEMDGMFAECSGLSSLNIDHFVTGKLENMAYMFYDCSKMDELHITGLDTAKVTDMTGRFDKCDSLQQITLGTAFTKWSDEAYLPSGYWKNGRLLKSETELYEEYGANAADWTGTWVKTAKNDYIKRAFGDNRYKTGMAVTDVFMETMGIEKLDCVIIASGQSFADALAGSYLAAVKEAPIILINDAKVDMITAYIRDRMNPEGTIYILGGTAAVSSAVEKELKNIASVKRLEGSNRYLTNLAILEEAGMDTEYILVGTGLNFADSLSASATGLPVLLVKDELNARQREFLSRNQGKQIIVLGGTNAVNSSIENRLKKYGEVDRIAGATRFETSQMIAERFFPQADTAVIAYSHDFPDGLCGGPLAYRLNGPVILTRPRNASTAKSYIKKNSIHSAVVMGGMARLDDSVVKNIMGVSDNYAIRYYYR